MTLIKMVRQTLFNSILLGIGTTAAVQWGREIGLNSKYNQEMWECIAKEQGVTKTRFHGVHFKQDSTLFNDS